MCAHVNAKRDFFQGGYTILKPVWINNMDHMPISGMEPLLVIHTFWKCEAWINYNY